jgi:hypothetical protein
VVLSYAYWHSKFHDDGGIVGRTVEINKHPMTIIGVAPPAFRGTELFFAPAFWIPEVERPMVQGYDGIKYRGNHSTMLIGRLKPGVSPEQATADLNAQAAWLSKTYPSDDEGVKFTLARPGLIGDMLGWQLAPTLAASSRRAPPTAGRKWRSVSRWDRGAGLFCANYSPRQ